MDAGAEKRGGQCTIEEQAGWPIATVRRCLLDAGHEGRCCFPEFGEKKRFAQSALPPVVRISEKIMRKWRGA